MTIGFPETALLHADGTRVFQTAEYKQAEADAAARIGAAWNCSCHHFGLLCPVDWWIERHGRLVGVADLKRRTHDYGKYDTAFINVRKWLALTLAGMGLGVPALYIVAYDDGDWWVKADQINASRWRIGRGRTGHPLPTHDGGVRVEPELLIDIPVEQLRAVRA